MKKKTCKVLCRSAKTTRVKLMLAHSTHKLTESSVIKFSYPSECKSAQCESHFRTNFVQLPLKFNLFI